MTTTLADVQAAKAALLAKRGQAYADEFDEFFSVLGEYLDDSSAVMLSAVQATSTTSMALGTGTKTLNVGPGKKFTVGMRITAANAYNKKVAGDVVSYTDDVTGALVFNVSKTDDVTGAGTYTSWTISLAGDEGDEGPPYLYDPVTIDHTQGTSGAHYAAQDRDSLDVDASGGQVYINLPATGKARVNDKKGAATGTNLIRIYPPSGEHFEGMATNEPLDIDVAYACVDCFRGDNGVWSFC